MTKPKCPYKDSRNKTCTHKYSKKNRKTKRVCIFNNPLNCPLFLEWMEEHAQYEEKSQEGALKSKLSISDN